MGRLIGSMIVGFEFIVVDIFIGVIDDRCMEIFLVKSFESILLWFKIFSNKIVFFIDKYLWGMFGLKMKRYNLYLKFLFFLIWFLYKCIRLKLIK